MPRYIVEYSRVSQAIDANNPTEAAAKFLALDSLANCMFEVWDVETGQEYHITHDSELGIRERKVEK